MPFGGFDLLKGKKGRVMPILGQWALDTSFSLLKKIMSDRKKIPSAD